MNQIFELWDKGKRKKLEVTAPKREGREWLALCPNHDDHNESLRINEEKRCYRCPVCDFSGPLYDSSWRARENRNHIAATYDYRDERGKLLFQVVRYYPKDFRQRQPDGKGDWIWNLKGVRRILYRLPELIKAPDPVFIVEGEKDVDNLCKWGLTATTSPMGAKKWKEEYNEPLEGREIVLVPDNHKEGWDHAEQIGQSLFGKVKKIRWLELPRLKAKEDVSDWIEKGGTKDKLLELTRQAPEHNPNRGIYQLGGSYIKRRKGAITNFVINPQVRVQTDQGEFLKASITVHNGRTYENIQFSPGSWISKSRFKTSLRGLLDLEYKGTDDDIQDIKGILASQEPPIKKGVKTAGLHRADREWIYVEEGLAWGKKGKRENIVYLSDNPYRVNLLAESDLTLGQLDEILSCLFEFNNEDIVYSLLGFCFACFVKERKRSFTEQNPILVCWGEKNSGKTETLRQIVKPLFGITSPIENIGHPTEFGFARIISSSNLAPIIFDEYKAVRIKEIQRNIISEMLRSVYNQTRLTRGTPDLGLVEFIYSAPIIVAGEMGMSELAIKDRIIETYFSKSKIQNKKEAFIKLTQLPLASLGRDFLLWTLTLEDKHIQEAWENQFESIDRELDSRLRQNTAHARLGLALFSQYLESKGRPEIHKDILSIIDDTQKKNILAESNKTIVDITLEAFLVMVGQGILEEGKHYVVDSNLHLKLHIPGIYPLFKKWARDHQWDGEVLDRGSFLRQLKEAKYLKEHNVTVRFTGGTKRVCVLDLSQMKYLEMEGFIENHY